MFQQRRNAILGNINLGKLSATPSPEDLSFLIEQAMRYRGRFVEVTWSVPKTGEIFQLTAKLVTNQSIPVWMLYRGETGSSQLIWGHNSNDLTLMHNLVSLECEKPASGGNSISADAMDNLISNNRSAGAMAGANVELQQQAAAAATAAQAASNNPSATWLQNLSYDQSQSDPAKAASTDDSQPPVSADNATAGGVEAMPAESSIDLSLDGSLSNITVANLFRYLLTHRSSGRLALQSSLGAGEVFFMSGAIKHAATLDSKGENALYDLSTWHEGSFHFHSDEQTPQTTVSTEPAELIEGCRRMIEHLRFLLQQGLSPASYLVRAKELNRNQFELALAAGLPVDMHAQFRIYEVVRGDQTFTEVLRACPLHRSEWIPVFYNLIRQGIIGISPTAAFARPGMFLEGEAINRSAVDSFVRSISDADGLLSSGAFLYLLQQENFRHERSGTRLALALFSIAKSNLLDGSVVPIDAAAFTEAARRILQAKRKLDVVGHFDATNAALLLPETDSAGAAVFANRITHLLKKPLLSEDLDGKVLVCSFGIASMPDDATDIETLIAAARVAKNKSHMMGAPVILFGN